VAEKGVVWVKVLASLRIPSALAVAVASFTAWWGVRQGLQRVIGYVNMLLLRKCMP
jgi:hypothetical protein